MRLNDQDMLVWALQHPNLYTLIELNPPTIIVIIFIFVKVASMFLGFTKK